MHTTAVPVLQTERLTLRPFAPADADRLQSLLSDGRIAEGTLRIPHPYPAGAAIEWISTLPGLWQAGTMAVWAVVRRADDVLVGSYSLRIRASHHRAEVGYWVAREVWGQGVATEAARAVLVFGFDTLNLHRIDAHYFVENPASGRVLEKAGMRHEGRLRGAVFRDGVPRDLELCAMLRTDPRS